MCLHSKASRGFLSRVHNPSLKIKRLRMDSKSLKNPINTPLGSKGRGEKKVRRGEMDKKKNINLLA